MDKEKIVEHFTDIYRKNKWHGVESKSGTGSGVSATATLAPHLILLVNELEIKRFVDIPCGDFFWMKDAVDKMEIEEYIGYDIVEEMIEKVKLEYEDPEAIPSRTFGLLNAVYDTVPKADMIFCRDCLVHFSFKTATEILKKFIESGSTYILMTTFLNEYRPPTDIPDGAWRSINFQQPPFNFPEPERIIVEGCIEDNYKWTDKSLGLWRLETLKGYLDVASDENS